MSMNPEQHEFEQLRRLLAWKRHEQPPPGYFNGFSMQVIGRIRAGEQAEDRAGFPGQLAWLQRLWAALETKPVLAGGFGALVCGLLVWGVAFTNPSSDTVELRNPSMPTLLVNGLQAAEPPSPQRVSADRPSSERSILVGFSSTNGGILPTETHASLFSDLTPVRAQPAAFHVPSGNELVSKEFKPAHSRSFVSMMMVTGPSLTRLTRISAPNSPV